MPRILQALVFFALLGGAFSLADPIQGNADLFVVVLTGSIAAGTVAYVLPWVYFGMDTDPARPVPDE